MTAFIESCIQTAAGSAARVHQSARGRPKARKLIRLLADRKNVLVTTHMHPDPDALASAMAMQTLLRARLKSAEVTIAIKGQIAGGINDAFTKIANLSYAHWEQIDLKSFDAIILLDVQPAFAYSPLPKEFAPTAVIDHHRARGRKPRCPFCDIRTDVGATSSILFSYFMELEVDITPELGAILLYAIESDLAGSAGQPGALDQLALSSLTLIADTNKLYRMRYVDLPVSYYVAYAHALRNATIYGNLITAHLDSIDSLEKPAVIADFLIRLDVVGWALVTAVHDKRLVISMRSQNGKFSAGDLLRRALRNLGDGGGHKSKAGGYITLECDAPAEIERKLAILRRRILTALQIPRANGSRLIPA
jgi:nanoRNase/pAp phosphatase (c-di-AMP/oligoRNAs hydrolase)